MAGEKKRSITKEERADLEERFRELQAEVEALRNKLSLPPIYWPHYKTKLDRTLHNTEDECPYCHGSNIDASDYDGNKELTCLITCDDCHKQWREMYRFIGAWEEK